jgi:hypothetical protein
VAEIYERVLAFIEKAAGDFEELAPAVFRHQFEGCPAYRSYCESRGIDAGAVASWRDIPPVPIQAFKEAILCCGEPRHVFMSTGTTQGLERRSRHAMPDLRLYRASAIAGLRRFLFPDVERMDLVSLIVPVAERPESSLAQMVAWAAEALGDGPMVEAAPGGSPDFEAFADSLRRSEHSGAPLAIFATTGALIHFFDWARSHSLSFRLPHGSRLMDTGGGKGAPRPMSRRGILHAVWATLAIPGYFAINEYGMAELSSQYYDSVIRDRQAGVHRPRRLLAPPWLRTLLLDLETLRPVAAGSAGLICHVDLANAGSAVAVLSEDVGVAVEGGLRLVGRAPRAESRGCSLSAAEWRLD